MNHAKEEVARLNNTIDPRDKECIQVLTKQQASYEKMIKAKVHVDVLTSTVTMEEKLSFKVLDSVIEIIE